MSTSRLGAGGHEDSGCTPLGWHRVAARFGEDLPHGARLRNREWTGEVWQGEWSPDDMILTRVLWLDGLEPGRNRGPGVDSRGRFIYVHGTNREDLLGSPASAGCVRVSNHDAIVLHDAMLEGDLVVLRDGNLS